MVDGGERSAVDAGEALKRMRMAVGRAMLDRHRPAQRRSRQRTVLFIRGVTGERDRVADLPRRTGGRQIDGRHGRRAVRVDHHGRGVGGAVVVGHAHGHRVRPGGKRSRGIHDGRVAIRSVAVAIPRVGERVAGIGIARRRRVELNREGCRARGRVRRNACDGRVVRCHVTDSTNRSVVEVGVEEIAAGADLQVDGPGSAGVEGDHVRRVGLAVGPGEHGPDALPGVVGEEECSTRRGCRASPRPCSGRSG